MGPATQCAPVKRHGDDAWGTGSDPQCTVKVSRLVTLVPVNTSARSGESGEAQEEVIEEIIDVSDDDERRPPDAVPA